MLDCEGNWSPTNEKFVLKMRNSIIRDAINSGRDVIVDDTNLHPKNERDIRALVGDTPVEVIFFDVPLEECLQRNAQREGYARVPDEVIRKMAKQWESWKHQDTQLKEFEWEQVVHDPTLPSCVIVDIDGTLAQHTNRSPYDWSRVGEDEPILPVIRLVDRIKGGDIRTIIFSGRDGSCREITEAWLARYVSYHDLFMREANDNRKDSIVKSELYDTHIKGKYNVEWVIDDRPSVCRMWRARNLFVLQVGDPHIEF